jgi:hypothetical protein
MTPWVRCPWCEKIVKINKPLLGSLHLCLTSEEKQYKQTKRAEYYNKLQEYYKKLQGKVTL